MMDRKRVGCWVSLDAVSRVVYLCWWGDVVFEVIYMNIPCEFVSYLISLINLIILSASKINHPENISPQNVKGDIHSNVLTLFYCNTVKILKGYSTPK